MEIDTEKEKRRNTGPALRGNVSVRGCSDGTVTLGVCG